MMKKEKKEEEFGSGNFYMNLDKTAVLQEARAFNETPINARRCTVILSKLLYLRQQGESIGRVEATEAFFAVTKLWQSKDASLRRLVYLAIKELCDIANDVIIVTSSLTKDMTGREDVYRAPAIRTLCCIIDGSMLQGIERYMKQAIVDKNPAVASAAIVSSLHLLKKNPEIVRRWANEVQEAVSSDSNMVQLHALGLLYHIRCNDHLAVNKLVQKWSKSSLRSPFATCYLIRLASKLIEEDDAGSDNPLFHFIESCLRHKCEMVIYEAASAIVRLPGTSSSELSSAVSVLQLFCSSPKPALRFAAVRTLNKISMKHPQAVISCNVDLEQLITDQNRSIATLAITTLLKTGAESSVERLMKQISTFVSEISDEFKIVVIEAIRLLCERYPRKHSIMMSFLSTMLRDDGGYDYKRSIVETIIAIIEGNPDAREAGLSHLCEFIEDCEHAALATRVLHLLGREAPSTSNPSRYIRYIYNRVILESNQVRAAAVTALAMFGAHCPDLRGSIQVLLHRCLLDTDDEVRDRATYYLAVLEFEDPRIIADFILSDLQVSVIGLERALETYLVNGQFEDPFDFKSVPLSTEPLTSLNSGKGVLSADLAPVRKEDKKLSRHDIYAEQLKNIEEFNSLGPLLRSSQPIALTDEVTEYIVTCIKHTFRNHIILQFDCKNTLNDQLLEDVRVELEAENPDEWKVLHVIPIAELPFSVRSTSYILMEIPAEAASTVFEATLKFSVKDVDPVSGEQESDDFYDDSFVLEVLEISVADFMQALPSASFSSAWQSMGDDNELEDTFVLSTLHSLQDAVREIVKCIGLFACERSDRVQEGKNSHTLLLSGLYRGMHEVLVKARLALIPATQTVTMNLLIRSKDAVVRTVIASAIV